MQNHVGCALVGDRAKVLVILIYRDSHGNAIPDYRN